MSDYMGRVICLQPSASQLHKMEKVLAGYRRTYNLVVELTILLKQKKIDSLVEAACATRKAPRKKNDGSYFPNHLLLRSLIQHMKDIGSVGDYPNIRDDSRETKNFFWLSEVSTNVRDTVCRDISKNINNFGSVKFKTRRAVTESFPARCDVGETGRPSLRAHQTKSGKNAVIIQTISSKKNPIKVTKGTEDGLEYLNYHPLNARVVKSGKRWYLTFVYEIVLPPLREEGHVLGVDMGILHKAVSSDGKEYENLGNNKSYLKIQNRMKRHQRKYFRSLKKNGGVVSKRMLKTQDTARRLSKRLSDKQKNWSWEICKDMTVDPELCKIRVEDLSIKDLRKRYPFLGKSLQRANIRQLRDSLEWVCSWKGIQFEAVDPAYTSQTCYDCGSRKKMPLIKRVYDCLECGASRDRDLNAALNLRDYERFLEVKQKVPG